MSKVKIPTRAQVCLEEEKKNKGDFTGGIDWEAYWRNQKNEAIEKERTR